MRWSTAGGGGGGGSALLLSLSSSPHCPESPEQDLFLVVSIGEGSTWDVGFIESSKGSNAGDVSSENLLAESLIVG